MRYATRLSLIAAGYFTATTTALPRPATYSVVNVDGGQTQSAQPTTIIQTVTKSTDSETTVSVTIFATTTAASVLEVTATNIFTSLQTIAGAATKTALIPEVSLSISKSTSSTESIVPTLIAPGPAAQPETVTIVTTATPTTTSYYDNGMWHTSYAIKAAATTGSAPYPVSPCASGATGASAGYALPTGSYPAGWNSTMNGRK